MAAIRLKRFLVVAAATLAILVVLLLLPPVQTALIRAAIGGVDGADLGIGRVSAGPWGGSVEDFELRSPGLEISVERADAGIAFWSSLGHLVLDLDEVSATGVHIRLGPFVGVENDEAPEPFEFHGLAPLARVPRRAVVRSADAEGTITVLLSDAATVVGSWSVTASNIGPDREASAALDTTLESRRGGQGVLVADIDASVGTEIDGAGAIRMVAADGGIHSVGDDPVGLDTSLELELEEDIEAYRLQIEGSGGHRLLDAKAGFRSSHRVFDAAWEAQLTPGLVAAFAQDRAVPELWGRSTGTAVLDLENERLELDTVSRFEGRNWADFDPRLAEVTDLTVEADVAATLHDGELATRRLRIGLTPKDMDEILWLEALQPVTLDLDSWQAVPEVWGEPAIRIEMDRFPLRWTRGFDPAVVVEDGAVSAILDVIPINSRHLTLVAHEPLQARGLQLSAGELGVRPPPLDVTIVPRMMVKEGVLEAEISSFEMAARTGLRVNFSGEARTSRERWPVIDLEGRLALRLPKLQHAVKSLDAVRGRARFALDLEGMFLGLDSAALDATDVAGRPLMKIVFENETPLKVALPSMVPDWESSSTQELNVVFDGLPIAWISPFIPELEFAGGDLYGELEVAAGGGRGLSLGPVEQFEVRGLIPIYRGMTATDDITVGLEPHVHLDNTEARVALEDITVRTRDDGRLDGRIKLKALRDGRTRINTSIWFEGDFPAFTGRIGRLGALSWRQECVVDIPSRRVEVTEVEVGLTDLAGTRFLELKELRPFVLAADPFGVWVDGGSPDILVATVTPLELQQLFPRVFGFELEGVLPQGQFVGRTENGGLLLVAEDELVFKDVSVRWDEAALLDRVTVGLTYEVLYSADGLQARSIDFSTLGLRGTPIADATLRAVMPLTDRTTIESLHFETVANLEPLTRQPIFTGLPAFLGGTVGGSVDLSYGDVSTIQGSAALRDARVENYGTLPDLDGSLDVVSREGQNLEVRAPFRMSSENGSSDLRFEGAIQRDGEGYRFRSSLTGDSVVAADVTRLIHLVAPPDPDARRGDRREEITSEFRQRWSKQAIEKLREKRDTEPFWGSDISGSASLDLGTLQLARADLTAVRGTIEVDPGAVEITGVEASMLGAEFAADGAIRFDGTAEAPYELGLESTFTGLDLGRLFRTVNPEEPPTLEGVFDVRTVATGNGRNPADLGLGTLGEMHVSGRDGVFRGLAGQYTWVRRGTKALGVITFSKQLKAVSRLLGELEALEFDTFDLVLARETPRRFAIAELSVASPLARIEGSGGVEVEPGLPLVESPLDVSLDLSTNGDMTILFNGLGLLQEGTDEHGYRPLTQPVTVGGTVADPDTSDFYEMLDEAATDSKGVLGVGMRKVNKKLQKAQAAQSP